MFLAGYQYIIYRKTTNHRNANGISRLPLTSNAKTGSASDDIDEVDAFHLSQFEPLPVTANQVHKEMRRNPTLAAVYNAVQTGDFSQCAQHQPYFSRQTELTTHQGCLLWGARAIIPPSLQLNVVKELHSAHCGIMCMKELARSYVW